MLKGFGITGYRSFGPTPQLLYPLEKINLIIGRNNVGKSNVLRLIQLLERFSQNPQKFQSPNGIDEHIGEQQANFSWRLPLAIKNNEINQWIKSQFPHPEQQNNYARLISAILSNFPDTTPSDAWITFSNASGWRPEFPNPVSLLRKVENALRGHDVKNSWYQLWTKMANATGGSFEQHHGPLVLERLLSYVKPEIPRVSLLSAHRQIGAPGTTYEDLNGQGLIARLLELQNPELAQRSEHLEIFSRINNFVAQVLEADDARLEIPHSGKELNVSIGNRVLPIESLGTGVHEVIIFAAAATSVNNEILCLEEPEIHLHPRLQRQLLRYLQDQTDNQYFITTHSACLLDAPGAALFHLRQNEHGQTEVARLNLPKERAAVGFDLGYRASDLVQANSIIWVEGPSDRIYINAWIRSAAPDLAEGLHYSIMFYGGRLLSHLSADDSSVTQFIMLQRLNRNIAIIIDSDKRNAEADLNATKKRVLDEFAQHGGYGWVTAGREIENYISPSAMQEALHKIHPSVSPRVARSQWDSAYAAKGDRTFSADKIAIARAATESIDLNRLDLQSKMAGLIDFLRAANN